jgi:hypothetical protein
MDRRKTARWSRVQPAVKEITMAQIGTFTRDEDGSYTGTIRTLSLDSKVRFASTEHSQSEKAPDLRVLVGNVEIGAAWKRLNTVPAGQLPMRSHAQRRVGRALSDFGAKSARTSAQSRSLHSTAANASASSTLLRARMNFVLGVEPKLTHTH